MSFSYGSLHLFFICLAKSFKDYHESRVNGPIMHLISALHRAPVLLKCAPSPDLYLASSIVLETACTLCLPKSNENKHVVLHVSEMLGQIQPEYCVHDLVRCGHCLHLYGGSLFETRCLYLEKDDGYFHHTHRYAYGEIKMI